VTANVLILRVFGPVLILAGALGFVVPPALALMSGAAAYNVFHIVFGVVGSASAYGGGDRECRWFNAGFGLVDLYQLAAHMAHWFPESAFRWTRADDVLHALIGAGLVYCGLMRVDRPVRRRQDLA